MTSTWLVLACVLMCLVQFPQVLKRTNPQTHKHHYHLAHSHSHSHKHFCIIGQDFIPSYPGDKQTVGNLRPSASYIAQVSPSALNRSCSGIPWWVHLALLSPLWGICETYSFAHLPRPFLFETCIPYGRTVKHVWNSHSLHTSRGKHTSITPNQESQLQGYFIFVRIQVLQEKSERLCAGCNGSFEHKMFDEHKHGCCWFGVANVKDMIRQDEPTEQREI